MTNRTAVGILFSGLLVGALGCLSFCEACNASQLQSVEATAGKDALAIEPIVSSGCSLAEATTGVVDPAALGTIDLICAGAEATDQLVARMAARSVAAKVVSTSTLSTLPPPDGSAPAKVLTLYRVRCKLSQVAMLPPAWSDAGADR